MLVQITNSLRWAFALSTFLCKKLGFFLPEDGFNIFHGINEVFAEFRSCNNLHNILHAINSICQKPKSKRRLVIAVLPLELQNGSQFPSVAALVLHKTCQSMIQRGRDHSEKKWAAERRRIKANSNLCDSGGIELKKEPAPLQAFHSLYVVCQTLPPKDVAWCMLGIWYQSHTRCLLFLCLKLNPNLVNHQ